MKVNSNNLSKFYQDLSNGKVSAVLLFGSEYGVAQQIYQAIIKKISNLVKSVDYNNLSQGGLGMMLNSSNFFGEKEVIKIVDTTSSLNANIKEVLESDFNNFAIFMANDLPPSSSIRKYFEQSTRFYAIGCYALGAVQLRKFITEKLAKSNINYSPDVIAYLEKALQDDDLNIVGQELDKLICYAANDSVINLESASDLISSRLNSSPDMLCIYHANSSAREYFSELDRLLAEGVSVIWIIRALTRYYLNLYYAKQLLLQSNNLDSAIKVATPPIFFKYQPEFRKILAKITLSEIVGNLKNLHKAEYLCKQSATYPENICKQLFFINEIAGDGFL